MHSTKETESPDQDKLSVKIVRDMHATKETKEAVYKSHVKVSSDMYATKETESHDDQIRLLHALSCSF
jgi:hypothetical protein